MTSTSEAGRIADVDHVVDLLDRASFSARGVRVGDYGTFQQTQNINFSPLRSGDAPSTAPSKVNDVPDLLSPYFLGRYDELDRIQSSFASVDGDGCPRCVIYGMPGLGKTQLALKYADRAFRKNWYPYLFWISATSEKKFLSGYSRILDLIGFPGRSQMETDARCTAAREWLESLDLETKRSWLIILDNATIESVTKLRELLPRHNQSGRVLVTTRTRQTAEQLATSLGKRYPCIELGKLSVVEARDLLLSKSEISQDQLDDASSKAASEIVESAALLPLAVFQAASYMDHSGQNLHEILDSYRKERREVLGWRSVDLSAYEGESLQATYSIALKELEKKSPSAVDLLRILIFLDPEQIPVKLLQAGGSFSLSPTSEDPEDALAELERWLPPKRPALKQVEGEKADAKAQQAAKRREVHGSPQDRRAVRNLATLLRSEIKLSQAIQELQSLSIVLRQGTSSGTSLWIHDLVQEVLFSELMDKESQRDFWLPRAIELVSLACTQFRSVYKNFDIWNDISVQVMRLKAHAEKEKLQSIVLCVLCQRCGYVYTLGINYNAAIMLQEWAYEGGKLILGVDHIWTQIAAINLGSMYRHHRKLDKAEEVLLEALKIQSQTTQDESVGKIGALLQLGWLYGQQGRYKEGEELCAGVDEEKLKKISMHDQVDYYRLLGHLRTLKGDLKEGELVQLQAVDLAIKASGDRSESVGRCIHFLGTIYRLQNRYEEAEEKYSQALQIFDDIGAPGRSSKLRLEESLSVLRINQGRWYEAREVLERVLETRAKVLDLDDPQSLSVRFDLAAARFELGEQNDAIDKMKEVARIQHKVLGPHHHNTKDSVERLEAYERIRGGGGGGANREL